MSDGGIREATSYSRAVPSSHAVARTSPSALNAIALTEPRVLELVELCSRRGVVQAGGAVVARRRYDATVRAEPDDIHRVLVRETASFLAMIRTEHRHDPAVMAARHPFAIRTE